MKRLIVLILLLTPILLVGCEKETIREIAGPTECDTTVVFPPDSVESADRPLFGLE